MSFKFIAINGDDVGGKIGGAIASDNHEELSKITGSLKEAHAALEEWAQSKGGEVVTSAGDEAIFKIPADSFDFNEVESLKDEYANQSGHSATIGIGDSMSEASKALIYGKMNEKDQVVEYDSSIDDYIADYDDEDESSTLDDEQEEREDMDEAEDSQESMDQDDDEDGQIDDTYEEDSFESDNDELSNMGDESDEEDEFEQPLDGESPSEETDEDLMEEGEISEEDLQADSEETLKDIVGEDETQEIDAPADHLDGDYGSEKMGDAQPPHEKEMGEEEEFIHDAKENRDDELDADDIEADMEAAYGVEDEMGEEESEYEDMAEEPQDQQSAMQDMIHANMEDEGGSPADQESSEELKQKIASTLLAFKENKTMLEQLKTQNPKMYQAQLAMIENMIDMAKLLNMNPEQDASKMEAMGEMPGADEMPEEEMVEKSEKNSKKKALKKAKDPKSLPDKSTKHIRKPQAPLGATKNGKIKVKDGETGKVSWRSGRSGMKRDWDGEPIARNYNRADAKERKTHTVHMGRRAKK